MKYIDQILGRITMYRLVLYFLMLLVGLGLVFSFFHLLPFGPINYVISTIFLLALGMLTNAVFAEVYNVPTNVESVYISSLILALVITPAKSLKELIFLAFAAVLTMSSKYILNLHNKHLFNPVAVGLALATIATSLGASWWVGSSVMLPFVVIGGLLIVRKIQRFDLAITFVLASLITVVCATLLKNGDAVNALTRVAIDSPLFFFAAIMITEPLTTPPTKRLRIVYGALTGFLFAPQIHLGAFFTTPETALVIANIYSYIVSPKQKLMLVLQEKIQTASDMFDFVFTLPKRFAFQPGQYMEWTMPHDKTDARGNRRYFTIASSPTEADIRLGIKFYPEGSSYKKAMQQMVAGKSQLTAGQLAGDFTLPKNKQEKLVFLAGGIGITPFRSMIKYAVDTKEQRDIIMIYANKVAEEIIYQDVWAQAQAMGMKILYTLTDQTKLPANWTGLVGRVSAEMIAKEIPDFASRTFYISGPHAMVSQSHETLKAMGIPNSQIHTDFFPGLV